MKGVIYRMVNLSILNEIVAEKKVSKSFLARSLDITVQGLNNKLNGRCEFKSSEISKISKVLLLTDEQKLSIFFA